MSAATPTIRNPARRRVERPGHVGAREVGTQPAPDGILIRPQPSAHRLVDHLADAFRRLVVRFVDVSPAQQRLSEHAQVAGRHDIYKTKLSSGARAAWPSASTRVPIAMPRNGR